MYVMADLSRRDEISATGSDYDSETLLCTVTYDKARKLLTISPDFISDDEHYCVANSYSIKYNYWIEHVSEEQTPLELQQQRENTQRVSTFAVGDGGGRSSTAFPRSSWPRRRRVGKLASSWKTHGDPAARETSSFICIAAWLHLYPTFSSALTGVRLYVVDVNIA